jgi:hypothetical protein
MKARLRSPGTQTRASAWPARAPFVVALLTCTLAAQSRSPLDLANAPVAAAGTRIAYGSDPLQFGELRVPSTKGPHPLAIVVHGGCWLAKLGTMDARAVAMDSMRAGRGFSWIVPRK